MREVTVHFSRDEMEAEVAASALRAAGDQPLLRLVLIVVFIAGATLGAALLAGSCAGSVGHVEVAAPADAGPLDERGQAALLASERVE